MTGMTRLIAGLAGALLAAVVAYFMLPPARQGADRLVAEVIERSRPVRAARLPRFVRRRQDGATPQNN